LQGYVTRYQKDPASNLNPATSSPPKIIGGQPRSSTTNPVRNLLEKDPSTSRAVSYSFTSSSVTTNEEIKKIDDDLKVLKAEYNGQYGPEANNNIAKMIKSAEENRLDKEQKKKEEGGDTRDKLREFRSDLYSSLQELRVQILNARRMMNDTLTAMKDELQRLILGRAATSEDLLAGLANIQKISRMIGVVKTLISLANKGKLCDNSNNDPSVAMGSFLAAHQTRTQTGSSAGSGGSYYNVYTGITADGEKSLLIAPSDTELELIDPEAGGIGGDVVNPETQGVRLAQASNLDEVERMNRAGLPQDIGEISSKRVVAKSRELGTTVPVAIIGLDLCKNSQISTGNDVSKIKSWAADAGLT